MLFTALSMSFNVSLYQAFSVFAPPQPLQREDPELLYVKDRVISSMSLIHQIIDFRLVRPILSRDQNENGMTR